MLDVGSFEAVDPAAASVDGLRDKIRAGFSRRRCKVVYAESLRDDRFDQALVEEATLNHAEGIQVVFEEEIAIVGQFSLQVGIA